MQNNGVVFLAFISTAKLLRYFIFIPIHMMKVENISSFILSLLVIE